MGKYGKFQSAKPVKRKKGGFIRGLLIFLAVVAILAAVGYIFREPIKNSAIGGLVDWLDSKITHANIEENPNPPDVSNLIGNLSETEPAPPTEETNAETEPLTEETTEPPTEATEPDWGQSGRVVNILVVGQAARDAQESSKLADTIMLWTLNKETKQLTVTSFLRDGYIKLPNYKTHTCGWNRINTAYALGYAWYGDGGAMDMLNIALSDNYGVTVDGDVEISFEAFEKIIDILGGVDINLTGDELSYMWEIHGQRQWDYEFVDGINTLNGEIALEYARMRHASNSDSDIHRAARQRAMIDEILRKLKQQSIGTIMEIIDEVLPLITTNISTEDIKMYISELLPYIFDISLVSNQCPLEGTYYGEIKELPDGPSGVLVVWDFAKNKKVMNAICSGEDPFAETAQ